MLKNIASLKRILALCFLLNAYLNTAAQSNFYKLSAGSGAGITQSFTEVKKHDFGLAGYGTLTTVPIRLTGNSSIHTVPFP